MEMKALLFLSIPTMTWEEYALFCTKGNKNDSADKSSLER